MFVGVLSASAGIVFLAAVPAMAAQPGTLTLQPGPAICTLPQLSEQPAPGHFGPVSEESLLLEPAQAAVQQHNSETGQQLVFERVVCGQVQFVAGTNYKMTIQTTGPALHEALVHESLSGTYVLNSWTDVPALS